MNLLSIFRRKPAPVIVPRYTVKNTEWKKLHEEKNEQLRRELGIGDHERFAARFNRELQSLRGEAS